MLHIGCHLSSTKGFLAMGKEAVAMKADTFAFFTRNPRGGKAKDIDPADVDAFLAFHREHNFVRLVAHAPYTMNLCAAKENIRTLALEILTDDLRRMEVIPGNYYNFHPGNHVGQGIEKGILRKEKYMRLFLAISLEGTMRQSLLTLQEQWKSLGVKGHFVPPRESPSNARLYRGIRQSRRCYGCNVRCFFSTICHPA